MVNVVLVCLYLVDVHPLVVIPALWVLVAMVVVVVVVLLLLGVVVVKV